MQLIRTAAAAALTVSISATANALQFSMIDLGTLGGPNSNAFAISNNGNIIGGSRSAGSTLSNEAFLYDGSMNNVGVPGRMTTANDVNNNGRVVGSIHAPNVWSYTHGYIYDRSTGTTTELGTLGGKDSYANAVNEAGLVVGAADLATNNQKHAFLYDGTTMHDLGTLGGLYSQANDINASNQIVGTSYLANNGSQHAFLHENGVMTDLGDLGGFYGWSAAYSINNNGQILGSRMDAAAHTRAVIYHNGVVTDLGLLSGAIYADGAGINNLGQVVGESGLRGFFYDGAGMYDLADLMIGLQPGARVTPHDINDAGQIAATITFSDGSKRAYLLNPSESPIPTGPSPVPLPAGAWLFGSALLGMAGIRGRRKNTETC